MNRSGATDRQSRGFNQTRSSKIVYVSIEFDRGAVYGGFLVYKTDQDWVVQNMEFNIKPELILPGLTGSKRALQP